MQINISIIFTFPYSRDSQIPDNFINSTAFNLTIDRLKSLIKLLKLSNFYSNIFYIKKIKKIYLTQTITLNSDNLKSKLGFNILSCKSNLIADLPLKLILKLIKYF